MPKVTKDDRALRETRHDQGTAALIRLRQGLCKHFGAQAGIFVDPFLWMIGCVCVDIVRLDCWLQKRNPDYRANESMRFFIRRKYGRDAEHFVAYWLKGERVQDSQAQRNGHVKESRLVSEGVK